MQNDLQGNLEKKLWGLLGLARRAGKVAGGQFQTEEAVKSRKASLVILAKDASQNTKKHFRDMCAYRNIRIAELGSKELLGQGIGLEMRSVIAVTDASFSEALIHILESIKGNQSEH